MSNTANADGKLNFDTGIDTGGFEKDLKTLMSSLNSLVDILKQMSAQVSKAQKIDIDTSSVEKATEKVTELGETADSTDIEIKTNAEQAVQETQAAISEVEQAVEAADTTVEVETNAEQAAQEAQTAVAEAEQTVDTAETDINRANAEIQAILNETERSARSKAAKIATVYKEMGYSTSEAMKKAWEDVKAASSSSANAVGTNADKTTRAVKKTADTTEQSVRRVDRQIDKSVSNDTNRINSGLDNIKDNFKKLAATAAAAFSVKQLIDFGKQAVETASNVAEVQNVVDTAFGNLSGKMEDFADIAIETYGISKLTAKQTGSNLMSMATGMGIAKDQAAEMSLALTGLSADMASFYNVEQEVAGTALKSIFTGETETLKQYGIVMTEANLQAYALSQGIEKKISAMSQAEKVQLRYNYVMSQTALAQGDFAKTSESWANQTRILSEKWKEFSATVGTALINVLLPAVKAINSALSSLMQYADSAVKALSKLFGWETETTDQSAKAAQNTASMAESIEDSTDNQEKLTKATKKTNKEIKNGLASFDQLNVMKQDSSKDKSKDSADPVSMALTKPANAVKPSEKAGKAAGLAYVDGFKNALKDLYNKSGIDTFFNKIRKGIEKVNWGAIADNFKSISNSLQPIAKAAFKGILRIGRGYLNMLGSLWGGLISIVGKVIQTVTGGIAKWLDKNKEKIAGFINYFSELIETGYNNLADFFDVVFDAIGTSVDNMRFVVETAISNMLGGTTEFVTSIYTIFAEGFAIVTQVLFGWATENESRITETFDNIQGAIADVMNFIGKVFKDLGDIISRWWNKEGSGVFKNICKAFTNIGTTLMNVFNKWIKPIWDAVVDIANSAWNDCLKPVFDAVLSFIGKLCNAVSTVWNNFLYPVVNWLIDFFKPKIESVLNVIKSVFGTVFKAIGDFIKGFLKTAGGLLDFITGVFTLDCKKAWKGIKTFFKGIWDGIWATTKGTVNLIIDGINALWTGIYNAVKGIVDGLGGIAGAVGDLFGQDWSFSMPEEPPLIPKLASGAVIPANYGEFAAILGDNKRETEVVSPLSTIKQALKEAFAEVGTAGNGDISLSIYLDGDVIFNDVVRKNSEYKKRHGVSAMV